MMDNNLLAYHKMPINLDRLQSLGALLQQCEEEGIKIKEAFSYMNGFLLIFEDIPGDAILHDGSYARDWCWWETIGMPWDGEDVSTHDPVTLGRMLGALKRGEDWEKYDE